MHHSNDPKRMASALAHYVDDSGSHEGSPLVVLGGPVFFKRDFFSFHYEWDRILSLHRIKHPIHMINFGQHGVLGYLRHDERRALFHDLVHLINHRKAFSLTVEIDSLHFKECFPVDRFKGLFGPPPFAFYWCMINDSLIARQHHEATKVSFIVAHSTSDIQMVECHAFMESFQNYKDWQSIGSLTFDTPQNVNALQAADMVAWANRKRSIGGVFDKGFEPLELLTRTVESELGPPMAHFHYPAKEASAESLSKIMGQPIRMKGRRTILMPPFAPKGKEF